MSCRWTTSRGTNTPPPSTASRVVSALRATRPDSTAGYGGGASTSIPPSASRTDNVGNARGGVGSWWLTERAVHRERRAVARAPQLPGGRVQPQRAALVRADARDGGHLPAVAPHEPGARRRRRSRARRRRAGRCWPPPGSTCRRSGTSGPSATSAGVLAARAATAPTARPAAATEPNCSTRRRPLRIGTTASASSSSSSVARRRRRSATNSSLAAPLPARPARSSIAARIWAASSSSGRKPRVRLPRNRSSTNRRTLMPAPHPAARRGAAPGAAAPWRWPR